MSEATTSTDDTPDPNSECPHCGKHVYSGSYNGNPVYRCANPPTSCTWGHGPVARTKDELRRVHAELAARGKQMPADDPAPPVIYRDDTLLVRDYDDSKIYIRAGEPVEDGYQTVVTVPPLRDALEAYQNGANIDDPVYEDSHLRVSQTDSDSTDRVHLRVGNGTVGYRSTTATVETLVTILDKKAETN